MLNRILLLAGVLGLFSLAALAQQAPITTLTTTPQPRTIIVSATAERMASPDLGLVMLAIQTQSSTMAKAAQENNTIANQVMKEIKALNITNLTIRTLGFEIQPLYEQLAQPTNRPPRIIGSQVTNRIEVRIPEANPEKLSDAVGNALDAGLHAGANRVDSVSFQLKDNQTVLREALAEATRNAHDTAIAMAKAADVNIKQLLTLSSSPSYQQPPTPMFAARSMEMASSVPIVAGELTISVSVNAVYEIN